MSLLAVIFFGMRIAARKQWKTWNVAGGDFKETWKPSRKVEAWWKFVDVCMQSIVFDVHIPACIIYLCSM